MIFEHTLRRELMSTASIVFTTFFMITLTMIFIKILGQTAGGQVNSQDVLALISFQSFNYLPIIFILTGFMSVLLVITRSYQNSEIIIWFISGLNLTKWIIPVLKFGWPIIILTALFSLIITPLANQQSEKIREYYQRHADIAWVISGKFQKSMIANRIFFIEHIQDNNKKAKNIFVNIMLNGENSILLAKEGEIKINKHDEKFIIMNQGWRYDSISNQLNFQITEFKHCKWLFTNKSLIINKQKSARIIPSWDLLDQNINSNKGEFLWRIALPIMAFTLMLLAIPLSFVNPREGKSISLLIALLLFFLYSNVISIFQSLVSHGFISLTLGWWPIHFVIIIITASLFLWRLKINDSRYSLILFSYIWKLILLKW